METILANLEIGAVVALSFLFALLLEPLLLMAVLGFAKQAVQYRPPAPVEQEAGELARLATGPKLPRA